MDFPFDKLADDIAQESPCGVDLEIEGDAEFMRFSAQIEGVLPASFASFDRSAADLPAHLATVAELILRSKDLRLLTAAAKLCILNRDLAGFVKAVAAVAGWMRDRWETLFPELMDGDAIMRSIALQSLDDVPHTVKPLEATPLFQSRRVGSVSLRSGLLAEGKIPPRQGGDDGEDEKAPTLADIAAAIREAPLEELLALRGHAVRLVDALGEIEGLWDEKSGQVGTLRFNELKPKGVELRTFLDRAVVSRDPALALEPGAGQDGGDAGGDEQSGGASAAVGSIRSIAEARAAMASAVAYFASQEPSSPVRLLLAQAQALLGRSFFEALQQLMPDIASQASITLGRDLPLKLPLERLAQLLPADPEPEEAAAEESAQSDGWSTVEEPAEEAEANEDSAASDENGVAGDESQEEAGEASAEADPDVDGASAPHPARAERSGAQAARNRTEAMALLDQVALFFKASEPSSPIPLLIEIARSTAGRDFMALLRESLPPQTLRVDE